MRQQLEEINTDRRELRKMLREQNSLLEKTNKNIVAISRSLQDVRDSQPKEKVLKQHNLCGVIEKKSEQRNEKSRCQGAS